MFSSPLYLLEFAVDDLVITKYPECIPVEYQTVVELMFGNVSICISEPDFGQYLEVCEKSDKSCLFALNERSSNGEELFINVYKKKNIKCKYFIGKTRKGIKEIFDKVAERYNLSEKHNIENFTLSDLEQSPKQCNEQQGFACNEKSCKEGQNKDKISHTVKEFVPFYNNSGFQMGGIIITIRLSCMGPVIFSPFSANTEPKNTTETIPKSTNPRSTEEFDGDCINEKCMELQKKLSTHSKEIPYDGYDEIEAALFGKKLVVRALNQPQSKNSLLDCCECYEEMKEPTQTSKEPRQTLKEPSHPFCGTGDDVLVVNQLKRYTGGNFTNAPGLPVLRGNHKYPEYYASGEDMRSIESDCNHKNLTCINEANETHGDTKTATNCFVLKLGRKANIKDKKKEIDIELKAPSNPCPPIIDRRSRHCQVEQEFISISQCTPRRVGRKSKPKKN